MDDPNQRGLDEARGRLAQVEDEIGQIGRQIKTLIAQGHSADSLQQDLEMKQRQQRSILDDIEAIREAMNRRSSY
jgi:hypothetical protein